MIISCSLILLTVPFPNFLNMGIVKMGDFIFNLQVGTIRIFHAIAMISLLVLIMQTVELQARYAVKNATSGGEAGYAADLQVSENKERN